MEAEILLDEARTSSSGPPSNRSQLCAELSRDLLGCACSRPLAGVALEQSAQLVEIVEIRGVVGPHRGAAVRGGIDQTLGLKDEQRLAHRRPRDAELARELLLLQARSGREPTVHDRLTYHFGDGDARVPGG